MLCATRAKFSFRFQVHASASYINTAVVEEISAAMRERVCREYPGNSTSRITATISRSFCLDSSLLSFRRQKFPREAQACPRTRYISAGLYQQTYRDSREDI